MQESDAGRPLVTESDAGRPCWQVVPPFLNIMLTGVCNSLLGDASLEWGLHQGNVGQYENTMTQFATEQHSADAILNQDMIYQSIFR